MDPSWIDGPGPLLTGLTVRTTRQSTQEEEEEVLL
jgi:hypothetical protein